MRRGQCEEVVEGQAEVTVEFHRASRRCSGSKAESQVRDGGRLHQRATRVRKKTRNKMPDGLNTGHFTLATSYSHTAYRRTTIGAAAFHFRVRNGNGWDHRASVTRVRSRTGGSLLSQRRGREADSLETSGD